MTTRQLTPAELLPHQQRVVDELGQLIDKIEKLREFISSEKFRGLNALDRNLLQEQFEVMEAYADILNQRIACWGV